MATLLYIVTFLSSFVVIASALDCYTCNDCKSFFSYSSRSEKCQEPIISFGALTEQRCFKQVESDGTINRGCLTQTECLAQETISKCREGTKGCYTCCDKPDCNSASFLSVSMATLVLSTVLAILRML